jgi:hypothetical protein
MESGGAKSLAFAANIPDGTVFEVGVHEQATPVIAFRSLVLASRRLHHLYCYVSRC